jgi:hypothetical protein
MNRQPREYDLAELIENPGLGLAMEHEGIDRRSLALLFEKARGNAYRRQQHRLDQAFADRV